MINFNKKDSVADAVSGVLHQEALKGNQKKIDKNHNNKIDAQDFKILRGEKKVSEEIDVNDRSEDDLGGRKKTTRKDDVGPSSSFKATKVRFHAGPKNESVDVKLADTKPEAMVKTEKPEERNSDDLKAKEERKKQGMKEEAEQLDEKNWIAGAIKKPGAMTAAAKREGKSTSEYIKSHEHDSGKAGKRARLAKTLKSFKEEYEEHSIYDQMIQEVLSKDATAGDWIHDFVHSDNPKFAGKSKEQRKKQALAAYYAKQRNEEVEGVEEAAKPDYLDFDKDGNKKESMKKALQDKKEKNIGEGFGDTVKKVAKKAAEVLGGPDDEGHRKDLQKKMGVPQTGKKPIQKEETVEEGWDDMMKAAKERRGPKPSGGSGVKQGSRYGGSKQKDKPEQDEDKKKVTESKRPETDNVPFVTNENTPLAVAKDLAKKSMKKMKTEMLGKISN